MDYDDYDDVIPTKKAPGPKAAAAPKKGGKAGATAVPKGSAAAPKGKPADSKGGKAGEASGGKGAKGKSGDTGAKGGKPAEAAGDWKGSKGGEPAADGKSSKGGGKGGGKKGADPSLDWSNCQDWTYQDWVNAYDTGKGGKGKKGEHVQEPKPKKTALEKAKEKYKPKKTAAEIEAERKERVEFTQLKAREKRLREMKKMANADAHVLVSRKMRDRLKAVLGLGLDLDQPEEELGELNDEEAAAMALLLEQGFPPAAVTAALAADRAEEQDGGDMAERLRIWLCLHMDEDELPEAFSASRGQFGVHKASAAGNSIAAMVAAARGSFLTDVKRIIKDGLGGDESAADSLFACVEVMLPVGDAETEQTDDEILESLEAVLTAEGAEACVAPICDRWRRMQEAVAAAQAAGEAAQAEAAPEDDAEGWGDGGAVEEDVDIKRFAGGKAKEASGRNWFGATGAAAAREAKNSVRRHEEWLASSAGKKMQAQRDDLPSAKSKEELLKAIASSGERTSKKKPPQVTIVQGETGCGKTTQVGQFILDASPDARVVVTQPRRVAAASVAQRVAEERGERLGDGEVGYRVRGESKAHSERCRLLFCTLGVFIRRLILGRGGALFGPELCTHLVVDEVHERSCEVDFLLTLLKLRLKDFPQLRVVLMSATMDVQALGRMFPGAPLVQIPGRTFPVQEVFLEEVRKRLGEQRYGEREDGEEGAGDGGHGKSNSGDRLAPLDFAMIARLVLALASGSSSFAEGSWPTKGAILIFMPGIGEIDRQINELERQQGRGANIVRALPLHGSLPPEKQRACFEVFPASGPRKVVVATNVAETSITLPDVTVVVDTARERRLRLEGGSLTPCLAEQHCAKDSLRQRQGRAGRVQAGVCFRLLTRSQHSKLPAATPPEMSAVPLESLVLQICHMGFEPRGFLAEAPTPPEQGTVGGAIDALLDLGALKASGEETSVEVTALGEHMARLPCDVRSGKLLVLGALLGCPAAAAGVAGCLATRSPLLRADDEQEARRKELRNGMRPGGGKSDHCLLAGLMALWNESRGRAARRDICQRYGLGFERMVEAESTQRQLLGELRGLGFQQGAGSDPADKEVSWRLLRAAVCGAFYPFVAKVERPLPKFADGITGAIQVEDAARDIRYFVRERDVSGRLGKQRAFVHPSSVIFTQSSYTVPYVVFSSKQVQAPRTAEEAGRLSLSSMGECSVFALLLFGGKLRVEHEKNACKVILDDFVQFTAGSTSVGALVECLRARVDELLRMKIEDPSLNLEANGTAQALVELLETDGVGS